MPFQLSPGVAVVEKDFTSIVPAVSSSIGAFAGTFPWGPVLEPVTVSSENDLVRRFGKPNDSNFDSFFTAANFLSYTNNLLLVRADAGSKNAVAIKTGGVTSGSITLGGSGYVSTAAAPAVTISAPDEAGGIQATAHVVLSGGTIASIPVVSGGTSYTAATVTITPAAGDYPTSTATAHATFSGGVVTAIVIDNSGSGYKKVPTVTITPSNGAGSPAVLGNPVVTASYVTGIVVDHAGTGYSANPSVTIDAPSGGTTATASAFVTQTGLKIINPETYAMDFANGAGVVGPWAAKYPGTLGNSISVSMADADTYSTWQYKAEFDSAPSTSPYVDSVGGSNDEVHIIVIDELGAFTGVMGAVLEKFPFASKASDAKKPDGTNNYYKNVVNSRSEYIWWMDHETGITGSDWGTRAEGITFGSLTAVSDYNLSGGTDVYATTDGQKIAAYSLFGNSERYDVSLIMAGKATPNVAQYLITLCEPLVPGNEVGRGDCVAFISPEDVSTQEAIIGSASEQATSIIAYRNELPSTSYAVLDSGYKYQYDRYNDKYRYVPLNADIAGLCARTDYSNDPWWSPGGLNRGQIKNVVRLAFNPTKAQRDNLYKSGVNPVVTFPGEGTVLFGDKTLLAKPSAFDRINVRRLFIVMEKAIATASKYQLFEFNDSFTQAQFRNLVEPFLRDVQGRRGITDFVVKCDGSNNTPAVIDSNSFVADIYVKPNRSINFITLTFVAARSGINFTEIGA
jgi:phage tail sheath protein FI